MKHIFVIFIVPAFMLVPLGAGIFCRTYAHKTLRVIYQYLLLAAVTEVTARLLGARQINNLPLLHVYTIAEFVLILHFFKLAGTHPAGKIISWLSWLFPAFCIINFIFFQQIFQFNSYPRPFSALIIIGFCMLYFFRSETLDGQLWTNVAANWIVAGLLVYFGSSLLHFAFLNILYEKASLRVNYIFGNIHAALVMIMYLLFSIGFYHGRNER